MNTLVKYAWIDLRHHGSRLKMLGIPVIAFGLLLAVLPAALGKEPWKAALAFSGDQQLIMIFALVAAAGIVAHDIKNGWTRGIMSRPVTRSQYLAVRLGVTILLVFLSLMFCWLTGIGYVAVRHGLSGFASADIAGLAGKTVLMFLQTSLIVAMATPLSCWIRGGFNSVVLLLWMFAVSIISSYARTGKLGGQIGATVTEYLFPDGFANCAASGTLSFWSADLAWGTLSLLFFLVLSFIAFNRILVDRTGA